MGYREGEGGIPSHEEKPAQEHTERRAQYVNSKFFLFFFSFFGQVTERDTQSSRQDRNWARARGGWGTKQDVKTGKLRNSSEIACSARDIGVN